FEDTSLSKKSSSSGDAVRYCMETALSKIRGFVIVEREKITSILREQKFQLTGATDPSTVKRIGKLLNADIIVFGSIAQFGKVTIINVKMVDVEKGNIVVSEQTRAETEEEIPDLFDNLAIKLAAHYQADVEK
ncbi:MAG: CsgG/HfaB family protein, partial [Elusimicrobiota bacterium]